MHRYAPLWGALVLALAGCASPSPWGDPGRDSAIDVPDTPPDGIGDPGGQDEADDDTLSDAPADASADLPSDLDVPAVDLPVDAPVDIPPDGPPPPCTAAGPPPGFVAYQDGAWIARCGATTVHVTFPAEGVARLRYGETEPRPSYALVTPTAPKPDVVPGVDGGDFVACLEGLRVRVRADGCRVEVRDGDGTTILEEPAAGGYATGPGARVSATRTALPGERFYGLGGRTGPLDRRGRTFVMRNTDAYVDSWGGWPTDADPLYTSVPVLLGLRGTTGYGVWVDNTWRQEWDLAKADADTWRVAADGGAMVQYVIAGPALADVLRRYTGLTGRTPMWPRWTLGFQQSRWGYHPAGRFREVANEFRTRRIPADGIWFDIQHLDGFRSWTWDPLGFPDPAGLLADLGALGFKASLIADPGIKVDDAWDVYATGATGGHFLANPDGSPFVGEVWPGNSVFADVSSPATRSWWGDLVPRSTGVGARGIWLDMNEPASFVAADGGTVPDVLAADGDGIPTTMGEIHNAYALLETRATWEGWRRHVPDRRPYLLSRAGSAGLQRYATSWTGDAPSRFETLRATLPMLLGMGMSGLPFVGSDVGGYSGTPSPELFARWMQVGAISPFFRDHVTSGSPAQEPWAFGSEVEAISRAVIQERYRLLPYWYSLLDASARTGLPMLRPLVLEFQGEPSLAAIDDEAMVGPWLLVAPVLVENAASRAVVLPAGHWTEILSGAVFEGPATIDVPVTRAATPTFVREGAILPRGPLLQWSDQAPLSPLFLDVYPADAASEFDLYEDDGDTMQHLQGAFRRQPLAAIRTAFGAEVGAGPVEGTWTPPARRVEVRVHGVEHAPTAATLSGIPLAPAASYDALVSAGEGWWWDASDLSMVVTFPDRDAYTLRLSYDPAPAVPQPPVEVPFRVTVPAGTPRTTAIAIATSADSWGTFHPLAWVAGQDAAEGTVTLPRGAWFEYKITRGDWSTVEKGAGCEEVLNRYGFAAAHPLREDAVATWADGCNR